MLVVGWVAISGCEEHGHAAIDSRCQKTNSNSAACRFSGARFRRPQTDDDRRGGAFLLFPHTLSIPANRHVAVHLLTIVQIVENCGVNLLQGQRGERWCIFRRRLLTE